MNPFFLWVSTALIFTLVILLIHIALCFSVLIFAVDRALIKQVPLFVCASQGQSQPDARRCSANLRLVEQVKYMISGPGGPATQAVSGTKGNNYQSVMTDWRGGSAAVTTPSLSGRLRGTLAPHPSHADWVGSSSRTHHPLLLHKLMFVGVWAWGRGQKNWRSVRTKCDYIVLSCKKNQNLGLKVHS